MYNRFFRSIQFLLYFSLAIMMWLSIGCQNTNSPQSERQALLDQLPPSIHWQVDSLIQIETMMVNSNLPAGIIAEIQGQIGLLLCERLPEEGIKYFEKVLQYNYEAKQWTRAAELHLFIARIYDEKLQQPAQALEQLMKAESLWVTRDADFELANTLQYEAVMEAQLGQLAESKQKINTALEIFQRGGDENDIDELYFDLAKILYIEKQPEQSLFYLNKLDSIWTIQRNYISQFTTNNLSLRIFLETGQMEEAIRIYTNNELIHKQATLHWMHRLEFLQLSLALMKKTGRKDEMALIEKDYQLLKDSLKTEKLVFFEKPLVEQF